jgi:uncharacterized membrane protein YkoI
VKNKKLVIGAVAVLASIGIGAGVVMAANGDDDEPLTGTSYEKAAAAALEHTGGGEVIETEVGDDGAAYGVEVRKDDGSVVEVNLDSNFEVIGSEADDDGAGETDDADDAGDNDR